jgi:competence protein ComEC
MPGAQMAIRGPGVLTALLWAAALLAFAGSPGPIGPGSALLRLPLRMRLRRMGWPLAAILLLQLSSLAWARLDRSLRVTFFAVGQGDAALVRFPGGRAMLIDAGGSLFAPSTGEPIDAGARELLPALAEFGVDRLDWAVLTHPHPDHAGGLFAVLPRVPAHEVWTSGEPGPGNLGFAVRALAQRTGARLAVPIEGQHLEEAGVRVEILHPKRWSSARSTNDNSLVLRLTHGAVSLLFAGDLEALAEAELAQSGQQLRADLLKAPHHGSRTSSTEAFVSKVRPRHVVFCVGAQNPFGFPHDDVVERYRAQGCSLFRTDRGAVTAESDGERLRLAQWSG